MDHENAVAEASGESLDHALARAVRRLIAEAVDSEASAASERTASAA